jgi:hypothetical protein
MKAIGFLGASIGVAAGGVIAGCHGAASLSNGDAAPAADAPAADVAVPITTLGVTEVWSYVRR